MKTPHPHSYLRLALAAGLVLGLATAHAADFTSTWNGTTGNWSDTTKWATPGAPGTFPNNGGSTYDAVQGGGTLTLDQNITIQKFTLSGGGVLTGANNLTTNDTFAWTSGYILGSGSVNLNGGVTFGTTNWLRDSRVMNLASGQSAALTSGSHVLALLETSTFNNNGTFSAQNNNTSITGSGIFNNVGTFTRNTGTGTFAITSRFNNSGTVNVNSGTLALDFNSGAAGGFVGTTTGDFNVVGGATLRFADSFTLGATSDVAGAGTVDFAANTVHVNGTFTVPTVSIAGTANFNTAATLTSVSLSAGNLGGSATVTSNGSFNWTGGQMVGSGTTDLNGGITLGNASLQVRDSRVVNLASGQTAAMSAGSTALVLLETSTFNNNGTFLAQNNQSILGAPGAAFNNAGTFTRNTGTGTFTIDAHFYNTGTINADTGTLSIGGANTFNQQGGTVTGAGIINAQKMNWSGGTFSGTGALNVSSTGNSITTIGAKGLDRTLNNTGTITYSATDDAAITFGVGVSTPGILNNSGTFNITSGGGFNEGNANAAHAINNSGTWNVSGAGTASVSSGISFDNSGAVTVASGATFATQGGGTQTGSFSVASGGDLWLTGGSDLNSGSSVTGAGKVTLGGTTINTGSTYNTTGETHLRGGSTIFNTSATTGSVTTTTGGSNSLEVNGATTTLTVAGAYTQSGGVTIVTGGAVIDGSVYNLNAGELKGTGIIASSLIAGAGSNTISPGLSPGTLTINGSLSLSGTSTLAMELGGVTQGSLYDYLDVNGALTLAGMLELDFINDFQLGVTSLDQFVLATANSDITGSFLNVASGDRLNVGGFGSFQVWYGAGSAFGASNLVLGDFTAVPEPSRAMLMLLGLFGIIQRRKRK